MITTERQGEAAREFVEVWRSTFFDLPGLYDFYYQCSELDALVNLLRAFGRREQARELIRIHHANDLECKGH